MVDAWFRNTKWSEAIEASFFDRLSRSRSQRDQQLAIQIIALAEHLPSVALRLSDLYFETRKRTFDDTRVRDAVASENLILGDISAAMTAFRATLAAEEQFSGVKTNTFAEYPYQYTYEVLKAPIDQRRVLCHECWKYSLKVAKELESCESRWAAEKSRLKGEKPFLARWLELLEQREHYIRRKPDTARKHMLRKLLKA